ncbi:hypothetical protein HPULCUR_005774 [Helicostylum pulchrum]|uniref:Dynein regulatory complex protein 10 n=1 Tax=Helicostylum pulchrum TaxID=562976 RepID=A0ABP9Y203_9FUNG
MKITTIEAVVCVVTKEGSPPSSQSTSIPTSCLLEVEPSEGVYEIRLVGSSEMDKKVFVDDRLEPDATFTVKQEKGIDEAIEDKLMCEKGPDFLMKRVEDVSDIWVQIEQLKKNLPLMLIIKLTNEKNSTQGRLVLVDLLYPTLSLLLSPSDKKEILESSCVHLYDTVRRINSFTHETFTEEIPYFLTKELGPYISGANKLILSTYFQDRIDDEKILAKTKVCLDFIDRLRGTRVVMLKDRLNTDIKYKRESENNIQTLQTRCHSLKEQLKKEKSSRENLKKQIEIDEKIIEELTTNLKTAREQKEDQEYFLEYIKSSHEEQLEKKDIEFQELFLINEELRTALDKERSLIRQIQRSAEEVKQFMRQKQ